MTMLHAFVSFMLVASTSAIYNIQGNLMCGGTKTIAAEDAADDVWVQLYYMERDTLQTYCTPFHVGGHEYDSADKYFFSASKGLECINECILYDNVTGDAIRAVTFYHSGANLACYCIKDTHYDTTAGMSTCNFKYTNDYMEVKRAKHDSRVPFSGKQMISLDNDNNFIHLEGAAGRTDNALMLMVKVTNSHCGTAPPAGKVEKTLRSKQEQIYDAQPVTSVKMGELNGGGVLNGPKFCYDGVSGFNLRVQGGGTTDDTALNGIELRCWNGRGNIRNSGRINGHWGEWRGMKECNRGTHVILFQMKSQAPDASDKLGATNVRMRCSDGKELDGGGETQGTWEPYKSCPGGQYLCGVTARIAEHRGDDTALNKMEFECCNAYSHARDADLEQVIPVGEITITDRDHHYKTNREMRINTRPDDTGMWTTCNTFTYPFPANHQRKLRCNKRTMARYVRIAHDTGQTVDFKVEVTKATPSMAFRKPAKQGTEVAEVTPSTHDAGKAVDGIYKDTYAHTSTFWRVDLKEMITIDKIILYLDRQFYDSAPKYRGMKASTSLWNLRRWTLCKDVGAELTFPTSGDKIVRKEVTCSETTTARAVKIDNGETGLVRLHEVEILEANVVWFFNTPYNCFDNVTPQFGCDHLIFELSTGLVTMDREAAAAAATAEEAQRGVAERKVYYKIKNKILNNLLYAGYDAQSGSFAGRSRHARVHSPTVPDRDYGQLEPGEDILLWELQKEESNDYYQIISKVTSGPMYVPAYKTDFDRRGGDRKTDHYARIHKTAVTFTEDEQLWELVKRDDAYYTFVNKKYEQPIFAEHFTRVPDTSANYIPNGKEIWDLQKQ